jgi:hypothetical protein
METFQLIASEFKKITEDHAFHSAILKVFRLSSSSFHPNTLDILNIHFYRRIFILNLISLHLNLVPL